MGNEECSTGQEVITSPTEHQLHLDLFRRTNLDKVTSVQMTPTVGPHWLPQSQPLAQKNEMCLGGINLNGMP